MHYTIDIGNHIKTVRACAEALGCEASINARNFALDIAKDGVEIRFQPRFFYFDHEKKLRNLTYYFRPDVLGFVGWLPYFNKTWPAALDKLAFKGWCRERGLRTPDWWTAAPADMPGFLVKRARGSLGVGMRGPYRALQRANPYHQLAEGEYYERFIEGRIVKAWYWNADPVCLEVLDFQQAVGDGKSTIRQLFEARLEANFGDMGRLAPMHIAEPVVTYQGKTWDTVLAAGEKIFSSFRYASLLERSNPNNRNVVDKHKDTPLGKQLASLGRTLWEAVPEDLRQGVLYTADGVLDAQDQLWLLEMNPNPGVHPDCYAAMFKSVLAKDVSQMPSLMKATPDAPHLKGGLVWASAKVTPATARTPG